MKKWKKLEQRSIENHSHITQWVVQLTCIQEGAGSIPAGKQAFFLLKINTFCTHFLNLALIPLLLGIPSTHWNGTWAKLNTHHLGTRICWLLIDSCFCLFFTARWRHWCREKMVNSCCTFLSKPHRQTVIYHLSYGFNPSL